MLRQGFKQPLRLAILEMEDDSAPSFGHGAPEVAGSDATETLALRADVVTLTNFQFDAGDQPANNLSVYWDFVCGEGDIVPVFKLVVRWVRAAIIA